MKLLLQLIFGLLLLNPLLAQKKSFFSVDDSTAVFYFYENDFAINSKEDTLEHLHRYDPLGQQETAYATMGHIGAAHYPLLYQQRERKGLDMGFHAYDGFLITKDDIPFYNSRRPYSEVFYSAASQNDALVSAKFSQNRTAVAT